MVEYSSDAESSTDIGPNRKSRWYTRLEDIDVVSGVFARVLGTDCTVWALRRIDGTTMTSSLLTLMPRMALTPKVIRLGLLYI